MSHAQERLPERLSRALEWLSEDYKGLLKKSGVKNEASIVSHASAVYGTVMLMTYLLGNRCEEQVERSLELSSEELRRIAEYLGTENKEDHRRFIVKLAALEAMLYQVAAYCLGLEDEN